MPNGSQIFDLIHVTFLNFSSAMKNNISLAEKKIRTPGYVTLFYGPSNDEKQEKDHPGSRKTHSTPSFNYW